MLHYCNGSTASSFGFMLEGHHNGDKDPGAGADMDIAAGMVVIAGCLGQIPLSKWGYRTWYTPFSSLGRHRVSEMIWRIDSIRRKLKGAPCTSIPTIALALACIYRSSMWLQRGMYTYTEVRHQGTL